MTDWVKVWLIGINIARLLKILDFRADYVLSTGELKSDRLIAYHRNLKISIVAGKYVYLEGSLHKYCKGNNAGIFTFSEQKNVLIELSKLLEFDLSKAQIRNFEFGVNIITPYPSKDLMNCIVSYKNSVMNNDKVMCTSYYLT